MESPITDSPAPSGWLKASYRTHEIPDLEGNIYAMALPPLADRNTWAERLRHLPRFDPAERDLSREVRAGIIRTRLPLLFVPLLRHLNLAQDISALLHTGYVGRDPLAPDFTIELQRSYDAIQSGAGAHLPIEQQRPITGITLLGPSGSGKTCTSDRILAQFPQRIWHAEHRRFQIVYLKVDFPVVVSADQLARKIYGELRRLAPPGAVPALRVKESNAEIVIPLIAHYANLLGLGLIILEELQNVSGAKSGGQTVVLNVLQALANLTRIPIVLTGTLRALPLLNAEIRTARRSSASGDYVWDRLRRDDPRDQEFLLLMKALFAYQWLRNPTELSDELLDAFYEHTQGIVSLVVTLFILTQLDALLLKEERISAKLVATTVSKRLRITQRLVDAYRRGDDMAAADLEYELSGPRFAEMLQERMNQGVDRIRSKAGTGSGQYRDGWTLEHDKAITSLMSMEFSQSQATEAVVALDSQTRKGSAKEMVLAVLGRSVAQ